MRRQKLENFHKTLSLSRMEVIITIRAPCFLFCMKYFRIYGLKGIVQQFDKIITRIYAQQTFPLGIPERYKVPDICA